MCSDNEAAEYCRLIRPELVGLLTLYCRDHDLAEDLAQQTLARVWVSWSRIGSVSNRRAYVHRMALNAATSWFRRTAAQRRARQRLPVLDATDTDQAGAIAVRDAVASLPRRQRKAILLRYFADMPVREVALVMGCAEGTVKALTFKAIITLRSKGLIEDEERVDHV